ncbi:hypothetical protein QRX50_31435 [Amycolatopsis carbonis]|uniref:Uncharacterized protein n=1 Tax=Amycolatopsis carbonis TaxID=715471 RepID=A0A9Y2ICQ5_9PSEU|nr:hypothetical protein [Amycolatopsis sp. 2-15]WIX75973.1 hypothetical protein QRX50_31435 [Amycolatopsis sp. 2-15]
MNHTTTFIQKPSDHHGEPCTWCNLDYTDCSTNIYVDDYDGNEDVHHSCVPCIEYVIKGAHFGDRDPKVEISLYPRHQTENDKAAA